MTEGTKMRGALCRRGVLWIRHKRIPGGLKKTANKPEHDDICFSGAIKNKAGARRGGKSSKKNAEEKKLKARRNRFAIFKPKRLSRARTHRGHDMEKPSKKDYKGAVNEEALPFERLIYKSSKD